MATVTLSLGTPELLAALKSDVIVASVADYVPAYQRIMEAIHAGTPLHVAISSVEVGAWLTQLQDRYGVAALQIEKLSYRRRLSELWHIEIPQHVSDEEIAQARLLEVALAALPGRNFEDFILELFFSPYLAQPRLPRQHLGMLLNGVDPHQWAEATQRPLVGDIFARRLLQWAQAADHPGDRLLIAWLQQSPAYLTQQLAIIKALSGYPPTVGQRVLGAQFAILQELNLDLHAISISEAAVESTVDQIRVYLEQLLHTKPSKEVLTTILPQISGALEIEFDSVQRLLRSGEVTIDADLIRQIRTRFAPIQHRPHLEQALADLDLLVTQPPPPAPDPDPQQPWSDDQWLSWAEQQYLPYRFWLEETGQLSGDIVEYASAYADWFYRRYPALFHTSPKMIYQVLPAMKPYMQTEAPVLVLVVDNFNAKFFRDFVRYMQRQHFFCTEQRYALSMLPSCTEVSKKCLLTGQPEPFKGTAYEKIVRETWSKQLSGRRVCYLAHIGALRGLKQREHDVYLLNYLPLDIAFHQDEEQMGVSHAQSVRSHLRELARDVRAFSERIGAARNLVVIVTSDHGSTRIPSDAPNMIDPSFFQARVLDKHHRYVRMNDHELKLLPDNIQYCCYTFERERFGLDEHYLAARAHYRFIKTVGSTYIHGGLTPEETLVPVAVFSPVTVSPKPLSIRLLKHEFVYGRKSEIRVELVNLNTYPCEFVNVEILSPHVDTTTIHIPAITPMSATEVAFEARFRRAQGDLEILPLRVTYTFLGQPQQQDSEQPIKMRSIMTSAFDLRDL